MKHFCNILGTGEQANLFVRKKGTGPEVIKLFSCSTQLSINFQLLKKKKKTKEEVSCFKSLRCCIYDAYKC